jgi:hypothetical protein
MTSAPEVVANHFTQWAADVKRCLEDVSTEMRARGRSDTRFLRLIERMPQTGIDLISTTLARVAELERQKAELQAALRKAIDTNSTLHTRLEAVTRDRDEKDVRHFNERKALEHDRDNWRDRAAIDATRGAKEGCDA